MNIFISQLSQIPIYEQIKSQLRQSILSGELQADEMLPSIRRLAKDLGIGIITVKRAYDDLCNEGLLISLQGRGVFVAHIDAGQEKAVRFEQLDMKLEEIREYCEASSITKEELIEEINKIYEINKSGKGE